MDIFLDDKLGTQSLTDISLLNKFSLSDEYPCVKFLETFFEILLHVIKREKKDLIYMFRIYNNLNLYELNAIKTLAARDPKRQHIVTIHQGLNFADILPNELFKQILKLILKENIEEGFYNGEETRILFELLGKLIVTEDPRFADWEIYPKTSGKDFGFILKSPDGKKKLYGKYTRNIYKEYYCSKLLSQLGIKMPEAQLLVIQPHNIPIMCTLDLSRRYNKKGKDKHKIFAPLSELINVAEAFPYFGDKSLPKQEQQRAIEEFLDETFGDLKAPKITQQKSRVSFAKILIAGIAFNLSDLGGHGGNVGTINTKTSYSQHYLKFGLVDFSLDTPYDITEQTSPEDIFHLLEAQIKYMSPIFQHMFHRLTIEDFQNAALDLQNPKSRKFSAQDILVTEDKEHRVEITDVFNDITEQVIEELKRTILDQEILETQIAAITERKEQWERNLRQCVDILSKAEPTANMTAGQG